MRIPVLIVLFTFGPTGPATSWVPDHAVTQRGQTAFVFQVAHPKGTKESAESVYRQLRRTYQSWCRVRGRLEKLRKDGLSMNHRIWRRLRDIEREARLRRRFRERLRSLYQQERLLYFRLSTLRRRLKRLGETPGAIRNYLQKHRDPSAKCPLP